MSEIARDNGMTLKQLLALNPQIKDANVIKEGEKINLRMEEGSIINLGKDFLKSEIVKIKEGIKQGWRGLKSHLFGNDKYIKAYQGDNRRIVIYKTTDGKKYVKEGGTRTWRNNNPGNLKYSKWKNAKRDGAIGRDKDGFGIFPDIKTGTEAQYKLLKKWQKKNLTLEQVIYKYAPPKENKTKDYLSYLMRKLDIDRADSIQELNERRIRELMRWIKEYEGWKIGKTYYK